MPATPAWPPQSRIRLFVDQALAPGQTVSLTAEAAHYLLTVMRLDDGAALTIFDDRTGEYEATIARFGKRDGTLFIGDWRRARDAVADCWLAAAPIRRARYDWVMEKACELGAARVIPLMTRRGVVDRVRPDKLRAHLIEAAEQCGRTAIPALSPETALATLLADPAPRHLIFADEEGGTPIAQAAGAHRGAATILIGPEGGFDPAERAAILADPRTVRVSLGPNILRADTAAVAALAIWLAV